MRQIQPNIKRILILAGSISISILFIFLASLYWTSIAPAFKYWRGYRSKNAQLIDEAKKLNLTYNSILADPTAAMGKPTIWCLRRTSPTEVYFNDNGWKRIIIKNPDMMYEHAGSRHQSCVNTLLTIKSITATEISGARNITLEANFVDYP